MVAEPATANNPNVPSSQYVDALLRQLQRELQGKHTKHAEIEALRFGEAPSVQSPTEQRTGARIKTMMLADLVESVKASITSNRPRVTFKPIRKGGAANDNSDSREAFWNRFLDTQHKSFVKLVDSVVSLGEGYAKPRYNPQKWPVDQRQQKDGESDRDYVRRMKRLKQEWGPPYSIGVPHPMTIYPRFGEEDEVVELVEHSYRPKLETFVTYGLKDDAQLKSYGRPKMDKEVEAFARRESLVSGQPEPVVRALPAGVDTTTLSLVTEYWNQACYKVLVDRRDIYTEEEPGCSYISVVGRTTVNTDPDKIGVSVGEVLRQNEPTLDGALSRMMEATNLLTQRRRTVKFPQGSTESMEMGPDNRPKPRTFDFTNPARTQALPAGAEVVDLSDGTENVFQAMPAVQLVLQLIGQHGLNPIFKGMPPSASGSGYRDNSLYMMAKSMFDYLIGALSICLTDCIKWIERQVVRRGEPIYLDDMELKPRDIEDWPCVIEVKLDPNLPQNMVAEAELYMDAHGKGFGNRRWVYEKGFKEEQPDDLDKDRLLENVEMALQQPLVQDVLAYVLGDQLGNAAAGGGGAPAPSGLVDTQGRPIPPSQPAGYENPMNPAPPPPPGGVQQMMAGAGGGGGPGGRAAGQSRQPPFAPGSYPPR